MTLSLLSAAERVPRQPAVVVDGQVLDYAALADRVLGAVAWLRARPTGGPAALIATGELDTLVMVHALIALVVDADWSDAARSLPPTDTDSVPDLPDDERPLAILHTSGTSGHPKGVVLSRRVAVLDSLERGPSGKLDRRATAELARSRLAPLEGGNSASHDAG